MLLKLSGEALMGSGNWGIDPQVLNRISSEIYEIHQLGLEMAIVVGGGNYVRGAKLADAGINRISADHMGMLATVMNAIALRDALDRAGVYASVMSAITMPSIVDGFSRSDANRRLAAGEVLIFGGGTGNPLVTTDTAASLRAIEIGADFMAKATNVDGVYSADPRLDPHAKLYERLTYDEALEKQLGVMDLAAFCQCRDNKMPIRVFNINREGALGRIARGEAEGTLVWQGE
jgi:uridylate kinase